MTIASQATELQRVSAHIIEKNAVSFNTLAVQSASKHWENKPECLMPAFFDGVSIGISVAVGMICDGSLDILEVKRKMMI